MENMKNQALKEGIKEVGLRILASGKCSLEEIVNISGLSPEEVKQLKADRKSMSNKLCIFLKLLLGDYIKSLEAILRSLTDF